MTIKVFIPHRLPGLNDYINKERTCRYSGAKTKRNVQELCEYYIRAATHGKRFENPVWIQYTWHEQNKKRDKDNISSFGRKVIQDALVACRTISNDGWANIVGFSDLFVIDKRCPGVEVVITDEITEKD